MGGGSEIPNIFPGLRHRRHMIVMLYASKRVSHKHLFYHPLEVYSESLSTWLVIIQGIALERWTLYYQRRNYKKVQN